MTGLRNTSGFIERVGDLEGVVDAWRAIYRKAQRPNPFSSWEWTKEFLTTYADSGKVLVWYYKRNGELVALAPLQRNATNFTFLQNHDLNDYCDMLSADSDESIAQTFVSDLVIRAGKGVELRLGPIRTDAVQWPSLSRTLATLGRCSVQRKHTFNPFIGLVGDFSSLSASRSKGLRQGVRTTINHLDRLGGWSFETASRGAAAEEIYEALVGFHLVRQANKPGASVFENERHRLFLKSILGRLEPSVVTHLSAIRLKGRIVSAAYSLIAGDSLYYWMPSFDASLTSMSLGKLQVWELLRECYRRGLRRFDFMGGDETYKLRWTNEGIDVNECIVYAGILQRLAESSVSRARSAGRRIARSQAIRGLLFRTMQKH